MTAEVEKQHILAIDLGTSGPKIALVSVAGEVLAHEFRKNALLLSPDGGAEQDPELWWHSIKDGIASLLARRLISPASIVAVSVTCQWTGTVAVGPDGRHLANALIWMDSRGAPYVARQVGG